MGCCGCSSYASTITAGIITVLDCILYLSYDVLLVIAIESDYLLEHDKTTFYSRIIGHFRSLEKTILVLICLRIAIRVNWLLSAIGLFHGNAKEYRRFFYIWEMFTSVRIVFAIATSIFALVKYIEYLKEKLEHAVDSIKENETGDPDDLEPISRLVVLVDFVELGPLWLIILIALIICVHQRGVEIDRKKRSPINPWISDAHTHNQNYRNSLRQQELVNPLSLSQKPNRLSIVKQEELDARRISTSSTGQLLPNIHVNEAIAIPRARLSLSTMPTMSTAPTAPPYDDKTAKNTNGASNLQRNNSNASYLAKRSSYLFADTNVDAVTNELRRNSNYLQKGERNRAYENRAFEADNNSAAQIPRAKLKN